MTQFDARLYRARDYPRMPWRNGGGTTQEVACNPGGSTAGFEWRLSIADVGQDGGFSAFDGFQRIITVLEGAGIELTVDGRREPPLGPRRAYAFRGDAKVDCRLLDGPIRDFNLFYAPARWQARLQWLNASCVFHSSARAVLLLNASDARWRWPLTARATSCRRGMTACTSKRPVAWPNIASSQRRRPPRWTPA